MASLLHQLITRGDIIAIEHGQLKISPVSGCPVPSDWLKKHHDTLVMQILSTTKYRALKYTSRSVTPHKGMAILTLQLEVVPGGSSRCVHFNVINKRERSTSKHKAGTPLPKNHFRVGESHALAKFWKQLPINYPGGAKLHDRIGVLKRFLFIGKTAKPDEEKLLQNTFRLLEITHEQIIAAIQSRPSHHQTADNTRISDGKNTDKLRIRTTDKQTTPAQQPRGLQPDTATGKACHGNTVNSNVVIHPATPSPASLSYSPPFAPSGGKRPEDQTTDEWLADYEAGPDWNHGNLPNDFG